MATTRGGMFVGQWRYCPGDRWEIPTGGTAPQRFYPDPTSYDRALREIHGGAASVTITGAWDYAQGPSGGLVFVWAAAGAGPDGPWQLDRFWRS